MINEQKLQEKWWWRTFKVVYILVWIFSLFIIGVVAWSVKPYTYKSTTEITLECLDKKTYDAKLSYYSNPITLDEIRNFNKFCNGGVQISNPDLPTNFSWWYKDIASGSWTNVFIYLGVGFLIIFIAIEAVKSIILYIIGIGVWRGMLLYLLLLLVSMFTGNKKEVDNG